MNVGLSIIIDTIIYHHFNFFFKSFVIPDKTLNITIYNFYPLKKIKIDHVSLENHTFIYLQSCPFFRMSTCMYSHMSVYVQVYVYMPLTHSDSFFIRI